MAMPNIPGLDKLLRMDSEPGGDDEELGSDLEDELAAILEGRAISKPKQARNALSGSAPAPRRSRASNPNQQSGANRPATTVQRRPAPTMMNFDFDNIDKLAQLHGDGEDDDIDESELNDDSLLQELEGIMGSAKLRSPVKALPVDQPSQVERPAVRPQVRPPAEPVPDYLSNFSHPSAQSRRAPPPPPPTSRPQQQSAAVRPSPSQSAPLVPARMPTDDKGRLIYLRDGYKRAALGSKKSGDTAGAMSNIKVAKQLDIMITALAEGKPVDMTNLPPPAEITVADAAPTRHDRYPIPPPQEPEAPKDDQLMADEDIPPEDPEDGEKLFHAPKAAESVLEALQQRLEKYKATQAQAQEENNTSKIRRIGRIVKQYETAIKANKLGKEYDYESLPAPPGFAPIPLPSSEGSSTAPAAATPAAGPPAPRPKPQAPQPPKAAAGHPPAPKPKPAAASGITVSGEHKARLARANSSHNKQLVYLVERQQMFKEAALEAKKNGDISQAKEYLRQMKGFDPLIAATKNGLPIDATSIPTPPQLGEDFVMVSIADEANEYEGTERDEMFRKVEIELNQQIEMCKRNKDHFLALGDVSSSAKFDKYAVDSIRDLDMLRARWVNNDRLPRFRYETRTFSIVICNPELGTNEASVDVIKAIDLPGKNDIDTYVKIEFPYPTVSATFADKLLGCLRIRCPDPENPKETPQIARTRTVKDSIHPEFKELFKFDIDRKSRSLVRIFKRHPVKLEVWSKGGFLRSDVLLGTAVVKLQDFETKCTLHESFPLMEGRKVVGGKVEAIVRIREPLLAKQVEEVKEKWLVFE